MLNFVFSLSHIQTPKNRGGKSAASTKAAKRERADALKHPPSGLSKTSHQNKKQKTLKATAARKSAFKSNVNTHTHAPVASALNKGAVRSHAVFTDRTCHQCKAVKPVVVSCDAPLPGTGRPCPCKFCAGCLARYDEDLDELARVPSAWACPACRGQCLCAQCRRCRANGVPSSRASSAAAAAAARKPTASSSNHNGKHTKLSKHAQGADAGDGEEEEEEREFSGDEFEDEEEDEDDVPLLPDEDEELFDDAVSSSGSEPDDLDDEDLVLPLPPRIAKQQAQPGLLQKKKKKPAVRKQVSDWDISRIVYNGKPESCAPIVRPVVAEIHAPTWRLLPEALNGSAAASPASKKNARRANGRKAAQPQHSEASDSEDEDISDSVFTSRHLRAASVMREQLFPGVDPSRTRV